jgi:P-type E1-E2 ATPase
VFATPGRGITARVAGRLIQVGSPAALLGWVDGDSADRSSRAEDTVRELWRRGQTAVVVCRDGQVVGLLGISDRLRRESASSVAELTRLTGTPPVLLTGDNPAAAARLAGEVGITEVRAGLLPEDKVGAVRELQAQGARLAVVGDGINDAPALAAAHVGIAMGRAGADITLRAADAVIVRDDLATIPAVISLSRRARRVVIANLVIASVFIAILVTWDLLGTLPLPLGVAGHEGSTVIVGLNGLRLLRRPARVSGSRSQLRNRRVCRDTSARCSRCG